MSIPLLPEILSQLKARMYTAKISLPHWIIADEDFLNRQDAETPRRFGSVPVFSRKGWKPYIATQPYGGYDKTVRFRNEISIPKEFDRKPVVFVADFSEALVFVNEKPFQGIDANHQEVLLTQYAKRGETFRVDIQAYSGRKQETSSLNTVFIAVLNAHARSLFNGLTSLKDLHDLLGETTAEAKHVRDHIQTTLSFFKNISPDTNEFDEIVESANKYLHSTNPKATIRYPQSRTLNRKPLIANHLHLIAHSHIDLVWLWTLKETKRKCARTFSTMLRLMDEFPEFTFTQSQALLYEFVKTNYPDMYRQIKCRVQEQRWHPVGAMWVEPDCNIPNGESLVRQILYGKQFFRTEFGIDSETLWLPDTFGYSWALPQILLKSGIKHFFTTKLTWNDTNKFPHNTFWWKGIDGSKVLAHLPPVGLEGMVEPKYLLKSLREHKEQKQSPHVMQTFGYGDGGGGPTKQHVDAARALRGVLPNARLSTVSGFFATIENVERGATSKSKRLPIWNDELYLELHRGTYTTHGWIKKANRESERLLYETELLCSLAMLAGQHYPAQQMEATWKQLLLNQFHDIVPGTAIADVYDDARKGFDEIRATCSRLKQKALFSFVRGRKHVGKNRRFVLFNSLSFSRSAYVTLRFTSDAKHFTVNDEQGNRIASQRVSSKRGMVELLCCVESIGPFSFKQVHVLDGVAQKPAAVTAQWKKKRFRTPLYTIHFGADGTITSLYDKTLKREVIAKGKRANDFLTFKDIPKQWDAWDIGDDYEQQPLSLFTFIRAEIVELGELRAVIRLRHKAKSGSRITQDIIFYHASKRIDFVTRVDWREKQTLLKVAFPLNVKTDSTTYETQFGALARTSNAKTPIDKAKYEVPAQQWADMSEKKFGASLLNNCKYGYDAKGNTLRLTLLRSPQYPHPQEPWWLTDNEVTDQGIHTFTYSLYPHEGDWRKGETTQRARELNNPLIVVEGEAKQLPPPLISLSHTNIIVDSVKQAEDGEAIIVRLHEAHGKKTKVKMRCSRRWKRIEETDLLERPVKNISALNSQITIPFTPFEIKTIQLTF